MEKSKRNQNHIFWHKPTKCRQLILQADDILFHNTFHLIEFDKTCINCQHDNL
jgi:hypothetical protein